MRSISVITFSLMVVVSYGFYQLQFQVESSQNRAASLERQITEDENTIKILRAEWALLSNPQRLQQLSNRFLELAPIDPSQIRTVDELAMRRDGIEGAAFIDPAEARDPTEAEIDPPVAVAAVPAIPPMSLPGPPMSLPGPPMSMSGTLMSISGPQLPTIPVVDLGGVR